MKNRVLKSTSEVEGHGHNRKRGTHRIINSRDIGWNLPSQKLHGATSITRKSHIYKDTSQTRFTPYTFPSTGEVRKATLSSASPSQNKTPKQKGAHSIKQKAMILHSGPGKLSSPPSNERKAHLRRRLTHCPSTPSLSRHPIHGGGELCSFA